MHIEVCGSICSLPYTGYLAHNNLVVHLAPYNYVLVKYTLEL